jgi:hypothetical protein
MTLRLFATELHEWNHRHWQKQNFSYSNIKQQLLDEVGVHLEYSSYQSGIFNSYHLLNKRLQSVIVTCLGMAKSFDFGKVC